MDKVGRPTYVVQALGPLADPAPLGWGGFALTLFMLSIHKAGWAPPFVWTPLAIYYGGAAQFIAGLVAFTTNDVFNATTFCTYGAFWLGRAVFCLLYAFPGAQFYSGPKDFASTGDALGWMTTGFFIFNLYMTVCALQTSIAVFVVFVLLSFTQLLGFIGELKLQPAGEPGSVTMAAGYFGFFCAVAAFYASFAYTWNALAGREIMPVGPPLLNMRAILAKGSGGGAPAASQDTGGVVETAEGVAGAATTAA